MLLAFDLDGTIVTHGREFPGPIRDAILAARDAGHLVTVITGRHQRGARVVLDALGIEGHYATCHGARVHALGDEHHSEWHLEPEVVRYLLEHPANSPGTLGFLSTRDRMFVREPGHDAWAWARHEGHSLHAQHTYADEPAHKFVLATENASRWRDEVRERYPHLTSYVWNDRYVEVVAAGGHKGHALARLAAVHGIERRDTVAFGDGDLQPGVAAVIDEHIPGPEELGVARWLERHALGGAEERGRSLASGPHLGDNA